MSEQQLDAPRRIVVGVDGSEPSKAALRWAVPIAEASSARIEAVIAWDYPSTFARSPRRSEHRLQPPVDSLEPSQRTYEGIGRSNSSELPGPRGSRNTAGRLSPGTDLNSSRPRTFARQKEKVTPTTPKQPRNPKTST